MCRTICLFALLLQITFNTFSADAAPVALDVKPHADPGKKIDLMPAFNPARDVVSGVWIYRNKILQGKGAAVSKTQRFPPKSYPCLQLFADVPAEYDFYIVFEGTGKDSVTQYLTRGGKAFQFVMNPSGETGCSLNKVVDRPVRKTMPLITPGVKHTALVQVRDTGVKAFYDGQPVLDVPTDYKMAGRHKGSLIGDMLNDDSCLGISSNMSELLIFEMTLTNAAKP